MSKTVKLLVSAGLAAAGFPAAAAEWRCSNGGIAEIRCDRASCDIERESFTPMGLSVTPTRIEICAYSGCFSGRVAIRRTAGDLVLYHAAIRTGTVIEPAAIILDTSARTALMRWSGFSNVMKCTAAS
jgi:hypothetical protein